MELGEKLRTARLEAGLSQRQLCGDTITRNMLSAIEHGTARPSVETLRFLAAGLGKPVSYFLDEQAQVSPNENCMSLARTFWDRGRYQESLAALESFREPDPLYQREKRLLETLSLHCLARQALAEGREPYARHLLDRARGIGAAYCSRELERQELLLRGQLRGENLGDLVPRLPSLDPELLLRAREALERDDASRAAALLEAAQDREDPLWKLLRGRACQLQGQWDQAVECLLAAREKFPRESLSALETCYRELGDYRRAYECACAAREV